METINKELLTVAEVSKLLKVSKQTVHNLIRDGLPWFKIGTEKGYRVDKNELNVWIESRREAR